MSIYNNANRKSLFNFRPGQKRSGKNTTSPVAPRSDDKVGVSEVKGQQSPPPPKHIPLSPKPKRK